MFKCAFEADSPAEAKEVANRDCGGSAQSAAELFAGRAYDSAHPDKPVPERIVVVDFCGKRLRFAVTSRVEFDACLLEDETEPGTGFEHAGAKGAK